MEAAIVVSPVIEASLLHHSPASVHRVGRSFYAADKIMSSTFLGGPMSARCAVIMKHEWKLWWTVCNPLRDPFCCAQGLHHAQPDRRDRPSLRCQDDACVLCRPSLLFGA